MKVGNLMKSLESDESRQPDEKFGKWWKLTTWWKVWKVMKLDNLMKSWESDEIWENVEKNAICFTVFLFDIFLYKRILPKSCSLVLRWPILTSKSNRRIVWKKRMKMIWTSNQNKRKLWTKQSYKPPNINKQYCTVPLRFLLLNAFESTTSLNKASNANASRGGGIIMKRTYFYFHRRAKALKEDFIIQIDCI